VSRTRSSSKLQACSPVSFASSSRLATQRCLFSERDRHWSAELTALPNDRIAREEELPRIKVQSLIKALPAKAMAEG